MLACIKSELARQYSTEIHIYMHSFISVCAYMHSHAYGPPNFITKTSMLVSIYTLSMHALPLSVRRPFTHVIRIDLETFHTFT